MSDLLDLRDDLTTLAADVSTSLTAVTAALQTAKQTPAQVLALRADLTGHRATVRSLRDTLDALAVGDYLAYEDGVAILGLWTWERETRHALVVLAPALAAAEATTTKLLAGSTRDVYIVRQGDTLQKIAARFLGDWKEWPRIAEANGLTPGALTSGTRLILPPKR